MLPLTFVKSSRTSTKVPAAGDNVKSQERIASLSGLVRLEILPVTFQSLPAELADNSESKSMSLNVGMSLLPPKVTLTVDCDIEYPYLPTP